MPKSLCWTVFAFAGAVSLSLSVRALAQSPPNQLEIAAYHGLHAAAASGNVAEVRRLGASNSSLNERDGQGRTPLMVAAFQRHIEAARALIEAGADLNLVENQAYDVITIAAVLDDLPMLSLAIASGGNTRAITSPYKGTALIAAAHLGHAEVVAALITGKASLDHVNNLGWTALIEAIVLGDGGARHQATVDALIKGGADLNLRDRQGVTPLSLARSRGHRRIAEMLEQAGAKP
jgi:ankyrin repeat protein